MRRLIGTLVRERLCAAGHLQPFETVYRWRGEIFEKAETRGTLYTRASLVQRITERVRQEHPYEVPHVTAVPLTAGNPDYLAWIIAETDDGPAITR
ncbi:periplasmic divalent cation tolerance protein [Pseudonocardia eucalypti]|nr:periplasmic divalent cation tolerance protein [Pseudonocardia eucalypti]